MPFATKTARSKCTIQKRPVGTHGDMRGGRHLTERNDQHNPKNISRNYSTHSPPHHGVAPKSCASDIPSHFLYIYVYVNARRLRPLPRRTNSNNPKSILRNYSINRPPSSCVAQNLRVDIHHSKKDQERHGRHGT